MGRGFPTALCVLTTIVNELQGYRLGASVQVHMVGSVYRLVGHSHSQSSLPKGELEVELACGRVVSQQLANSDLQKRASMLVFRDCAIGTLMLVQSVVAYLDLVVRKFRWIDKQ